MVQVSGGLLGLDLFEYRLDLFVQSYRAIRGGIISMHSQQ